MQQVLWNEGSLTLSSCLHNSLQHSVNCSATFQFQVICSLLLGFLMILNRWP